MWSEFQVVDADSHVMEPLWLWPRYLDREYRDSCLRVVRDPDDGDRLVIDGRPSRLIRRLGGARAERGEDVPDWNTLPRPPGGYLSYRDSLIEASFAGPARASWLDGHGIDQALLFPSLGLIWPREVAASGPYARAHYAAYNRWILDFCDASPGRLVPVAQFGLDPEAPAGRQVERLRDEGFAHVMFPMGTDLGVDLDDLWAALSATHMTVHLHKVAIPHGLDLPSGTSLASGRTGAFFNHVNEILPGQLFLAALLGAGVCDRFGALRFVFHECNAGWLMGWLDRAMESWETLNGRSGMANPPTHYVLERDTFFFSVGLGEDLRRIPVDLRGRLLLATDYPHPGSPSDPQRQWLARLEESDTAFAEGILGENARRMMEKERVS